VGLELIEGRDFVTESETDRKESAIVTEETVRKFGWSNPLGTEITLLDTIKLTVIGVVKNIYNNGLWKNLDPMVIRKADREAIYYIIVSTQASKVQEVNKFMGNKWKELFPDRIFDSRTIDNGLYEANRVNNNVVKMSTFLGVVSLLLSVTGLFTLISLNINNKIKEIGVRKVLGASTFSLTWVLNREFIIVLLLACLGGSLLGTFIVKSLMSDLWKYHQPVTYVTLLSSIIVLLVASVLSNIHKIYNTTRLNPSDILRDE
jgi:ABC-type antimicrobial peptide transport system permease subunit